MSFIIINVKMSHSPAADDVSDLRSSSATNHSTPAAVYDPHTHKQPIVTQPTFGEGSRGPPADTWMAIPAQVPDNMLPSLQYLMRIDLLFVEQEIGRVAPGVRRNRYTVKNREGQKVFFAFEEDSSGWTFSRYPNRLFDIHLLDNHENEIIHLHRYWTCCTMDELHVFSPPGNLVGKVKRLRTCCTPEFKIVNGSGANVMKILGPPSCCNYVGLGNVDFNIVSKNESTKVGRISRHLGGFWRETYTDLDIFGVSFPADLDVRMKAVLLGACFLIDFVFFESPNYTRQLRDNPVAMGAAAGAVAGAAAAAYN